MTQIDMIRTQETVEDTEKMLQDICSFRLKGGCGSGIKDRCFKMVMGDRCSKCILSRVTAEHKKDLLRR